MAGAGVVEATCRLSPVALPQEGQGESGPGLGGKAGEAAVGCGDDQP